MLYQKMLVGKHPYIVMVGDAVPFECHRHPEIELSYCLEGEYTVVIEGKIQDETWYWPIDINRDSGPGEEGGGPGEGVGIERNRRYIFDVTIRGKGTKDPDMPVTSMMAETILKVQTWKEKEEYYVGF